MSAFLQVLQSRLTDLLGKFVDDFLKAGADLKRTIMCVDQSECLFAQSARFFQLKE